MRWSLELFHQWLQGEYSAVLYGGTHRLPALNDLKLVWLRLLDNDTLRCLPPLCFWDTLESASSLSARHSYLFEPSNTMWIQNAVKPLESHAWAEVTHCRERNESVSDESTTSWEWKGHRWYYHTPGSGQSLNIGRTLILQYHTGDVEHISEDYDSVQFLDDRNDMEKLNRLRPRHEILMLRNPIGPPLVRCGRYPWLAQHECPEDSEPIRGTAMCDTIDSFKARLGNPLPCGSWCPEHPFPWEDKCAEFKGCSGCPQCCSGHQTSWRWACAPAYQDLRVQSLVRVEYGTPSCPFDNKKAGPTLFRARQPMNASCELSPVLISPPSPPSPLPTAHPITHAPHSTLPPSTPHSTQSILLLVLVLLWSGAMVVALCGRCPLRSGDGGVRVQKDVREEEQQQGQRVDGASESACASDEASTSASTRTGRHMLYGRLPPEDGPSHLTSVWACSP